MRRLILLYVSLALFLQATTLGEYQESGGVLSMEAENGTIGSRWFVGADSEASGDAYIEIDPAYNHTGTSPECADPECLVSYDFHLSTGGNYRFWFRMHSGSASDDSFFWRIDSGSWNYENNRYGIGSWFSTNNTQVGDLVAGSHVLEIAYRENGTRLDKFVIQLDSMADPSGDGPPESSTGPNDQPPLAPNDLTASISGNQVDLTWTPAAGASGYHVKRSTTSGGPYDTIASDVTTTDYSDTTVVENTTYFYVVTAENTYGESAHSNEVSATFAVSIGFQVDFSALGSPVQNGYEVYSATHEDPATFTTQSFSVFGTTVSITPTWAANAVASSMQMIDRGAGYFDAEAALIRDWIGTDARSAGDPLTLTISGLPAGTYSWVSYHHDSQDQTGQFDLHIYDAGGQHTISTVDISDGANVPFEDITKVETVISSNGIDDVYLVFTVISSTSNTGTAFFVMNGFEMYSVFISPCSNSKPVIESDHSLTLQAEIAHLIDVAVSDDGKPFIEGCDPDNYQPGTSYPLEYQWSQISGDGTVIFDPPSADLLNTTVTFPGEGLYEISLDVSDGPISEPDRKTAQRVITVDVTASPCSNEKPVIEHAETLLALAGRPIVIELTVSDDGRPFIEGCDPYNPQSGTSYPLEYQWSQVSGSGTVTLDPPSADLPDTTILFPLQGLYEISLEVSDGPISEPGRKTAQQSIVVHVIETADGDINFDGFVNIQDLEYLAEQWLSPCIPQLLYCADIDDSGLVSMADYMQLSSNWMKGDPGVVINEFVSSNSSSYPDGDGNYPDWIELYNQSTEIISLAGWYLTDDNTNLQKWEFPPDTFLAPGEYMLVFASNPEVDNYVDQAGNLHANFALDKDGEYLALVSPFGGIVHEYEPEYPEQKTDISYGLWYGMERYFVVPTPLAANSNQFLGFTDKPDYSHDRGFYDQPFDLEISSDIADAFIRYTLDGSEPTEQHGMIYEPNVPIHIDTTSVVRAAAFKPGYLPGKVKTATFIFVDDVAQQPTDPAGWPDTWGSEPAQYSGPAIEDIFADYEMDPRVVNNTLPGYSIREALMDIPSISIAMEPVEFIGPDDGDGLWTNPLITTEYKCSIEYIPVDASEDDFQEDCKVENHGFSSRFPQRMQKHNLRITFTGEYGASKLNHPLFPDSPVETFNQLILRAFSTDSWALVSWGDGARYRPNDSQYIRDVWMKRSLRDMGQPSSYGRYMHLYVNGLYFGLFDVTESVDEAFCEEHFGGESEDWTVGKDFSGVPSYWYSLLNTDVSTLSGYEQGLNYIDMENLADYMLLHFYADVDDWPHHNGIVVNNTVSGDGKMRFFVWDQAISLDAHGKGATKIDNGNGVGALFQEMRTSEEFRLLFADRVYKHCFNDGALSVFGSQNRYLEIANMIDKAIVAESARWGDVQMSTSYGSTITQPSPLDDINHRFYPPAPNGPDYYFTREDAWIVERDNVIHNYIPAIHDMSNAYAIVRVFRDKNLYPAIDPPQFFVNEILQHGGYISASDVLTLVNLNAGGTIYYTLDGSDPRLPGGAVNTESAAAYSGAIALSRSTVLKARILDGSQWSALAQTTFAVGPVCENLRVTELMYHPADPNTEFIELLNVGTEAINLNLVKFTKGVDYTFGDMTLAPNEYVLIVQDPTAFTNRYGSGLPVAGRYDGQLDNGGERIKLKDAVGTEIQDFDYKDGWYELTDGYGFSLTMVNPAGSDPNLWDSKAGWRSSLAEGGTPGAAAQTTLTAGSIVINELLAHSHNGTDWIELHNTTGQSINIGGWFLSDDDSDPNSIRKYEIPADTVMAAGGYHLFDQMSSFGSLSQPQEKRFALSEGGETLYLYSGDNGQITGFYQTQENFDASETAVTFGRYEKAELSGGYDFTRMLTPTPGAANSGPRIPAIVITEIHYNPAQGADYEFVELYNRSALPVTLMTETTTETSPGVFETQMLPWRLEGTGYEFPDNTVIEPGEYILVAKNPAMYSSLTCDLYGPYDGKLDNAGEQIELQIPGDLEYGKDRYWIPIEKIDYDDTDPWPTSADGGGDALQRQNVTLYGRDYSNWIPRVPKPGN